MPWTVAHQVPLSRGFSRQEYWAKLSFLSLGDLPDTGMEPASTLPVEFFFFFFYTEPPGKPIRSIADKSLHSCPTLCDPIDGSPPGSAVPGILQARMLEWVAISFSNAWKWKVKVRLHSCVQLLATPWTTAYQAPPSMGFSWQEYWSGLPLPSL